MRPVQGNVPRDSRADPAAAPRINPSRSGRKAGRESAALLERRLHSLDAYRGLIMISLAFGGFGLAATASAHLAEAGPSSFWEAVRYQFSHTEWAGCSYWDLIQPSFMFMVGMSMAYSYGHRKSAGHSYARMLGHAMWRSVVLIILGIFLISNWGDSTNWSLMNVLTQMGLGYTFLFLLWGRSLRTQALAAGAILFGTWLLYVTYPGSGVPPSGAPAAGVSADWAAEHLRGIGAAWHKNANVGHAIDLRLLNLLPQTERFTYNSGGYQTINFIPSLATMLFGLMCGELLRSDRTERRKLQVLAVAGAAGLLSGWVLHQAGISPLVKRIWTPSWALFSTGWCCLILAFLYGTIDVLGFRRWSFPLIVVGLNSIAIYCMSMLLKPWVAKTLEIHLGKGIYALGGELYQPALRATLVGLVFWLACYWLYRKRIFIRI